MLGYVIARNIKSKILIFWKVGGAKVSVHRVRFKTLLGLRLSNWDFCKKKKSIPFPVLFDFSGM